MGDYKCAVKKDSKSFIAYGADEITERHRHRYEFNNDYRERLTNAGLVISGTWRETRSGISPRGLFPLFSDCDPALSRAGR